MGRSTKEIQGLVGPLDPMRDSPPDAPPPAFDHARAASAARSTGSSRATNARRSILAVGTAVLLVAGGAVVWNVAGPSSLRGYAATPPPLAIMPSNDGRPAKVVLEEVAARAATSAVPAGSPGDSEYIKTRGWALNSQVGSSGTVSAVEATESEVWRHPDGSGRSVTRKSPPEFQSDADREKWVSDHIGSEVARDFDPGHFTGDLMKPRPPIAVDTLHQWLRDSHPYQDDPQATVDATTDLLRERVLLPAERSAVLRVIAGLSGLTHDGSANDRAGRRGLAFSVHTDGPGLPARHTFIIDSFDGRILGFEKSLTRDPGQLRVRIPAVISYYVYLACEFRR